uniref:Uncharacterized protein n=1 Tax=uncultured alpha proteobacterium HF0010_13E22 TaxID=710801 RepID=E0XR08_9PROT|nr:hypothetical protein [uncultured alpha proteobacterium HF0010_13E22]
MCLQRTVRSQRPPPANLFQIFLHFQTASGVQRRGRSAGWLPPCWVVSALYKRDLRSCPP